MTQIISEKEKENFYQPLPVRCWPIQLHRPLVIVSIVDIKKKTFEAANKNISFLPLVFHMAPNGADQIRLSTIESAAHVNVFILGRPCFVLFHEDKFSNRNLKNLFLYVLILKVITCKLFFLFLF